jgi:hypothetical protein
MENYINKDDLINKIRMIINDENESFETFEHRKNVSELQRHNTRIDLLNYIISLIDDIKVKEVDLESEIDKYLQPLAAWEIQEAPFTSMENIAKHFFELGLKAQKEE